MSAATASRTRRAHARSAAAVLAGAIALGLSVAPHALADDNPYPSASAEPPVKVDPSAPGLKLPSGAQLAPPKVLDIKSVVEDLGGEERREDTNADVKFALQSEVLFDKDSAKLNGAANSRIADVAAEIKKQGSKTVRVFGFTDNLGSHAHGMVLSKDRANAVQKVLDRELNDPSIQFEIRGYAEQFPVAENSTEEGRKKNRRVEISFPRGNASGN
ncbi:OmpA family protein [Streptomyces sp. RY43-2]|uniref:OmpA family protein n=1 Tax=Streptomyces macrolidinus TaxID=2952607 RepID=A0ABT0ZLK2_9ACTN|nr:OmpA family protein [Streptomyces macrolidinus]MCN9244456.1 OmpA family protein [Streptomyces macrolidinus]